METVLQDVRVTLRAFRRSPGFPLTAIATLALGIGATTAIFTALSAVPSQAAAVSEPRGSVRPPDGAHGWPGHHRPAVGRRDLSAERSDAIDRTRGGIPAG